MTVSPENAPGSSLLALEALLLASPVPVSLANLTRVLPGEDVDSLVALLEGFWRPRGMSVVVRAGEVAMVPDPACLRVLSEAEGRRARRLSQAAVETLSYVAMHQPVSTADIERGRGLKIGKGVMDSLLDAGFVRIASRRTDSGRAVAYVTTDAFLAHFGLSALADLPTVDELAGLVDPPTDPSAEGLPTPA